MISFSTTSRTFAILHNEKEKTMKRRNMNINSKVPDAVSKTSNELTSTASGFVLPAASCTNPVGIISSLAMPEAETSRMLEELVL